MTWDPVPRIILFFSNLLLVFARVNSIVIFMYYWGPGEFKPGMFAITIHIIIMMGIHLRSLNPLHKLKNDNMDKWKKLRVIRHLLYVCFNYGFTNIMVNNFYEVTLTANQELGKKPKNTRNRQLIADVIFTAENIFLSALDTFMAILFRYIL